ncbi:MAG: ROK family protein [Solirubrobacteraceae bacterium]
MGPVVGVDLGGTKVAAAALSDGVLGDPVLRATDLTSREALLDELVALIDEIRPPDLQGVGVGVPSIVEFETGRVVSSVNVPLADVPLRHVLSDRLGLPVFVDNDATVAALAEALDEDLRPAARNLVMLTFGTGVGGGIVIGGRIYRGSSGGAGELGHTIVAAEREGEVPVEQTFPQPGSLESVASGHALDHLAVRSAEEHPEGALGRLQAAGQPVTGVEVVDAAQAGDAVARRTIQLWAERVGIGVANAINTFDPDEVVIGGGAARAGELLLESACRVARAYIVPGLGTRTKIRLARYGQRAGVLGAAMLAVHELELSSHDAADNAGPSRPFRTPEVSRP